MLVSKTENNGRKLYDDEIVHHKNGDIHDYRIENLELMTIHPYGQRVEDMIPYCLQYIERYCPEKLKQEYNMISNND